MIEGETVPIIVRGYDRARVGELLETLRDSGDRDERKLAWRGLQQFTVNLYVHQAKKLEAFLSDVPELVARAKWLGVDPPAVKEWPVSAKYHDKLGIMPDFNIDEFTVL